MTCLRGAAAKKELSLEDLNRARDAREGEQWVTQHHCETGKKQRLYIKRTGPSVIFHCHNCNVSGIYSLGGSDSIRRISRLVTTETIVPYYDEFEKVVDILKWGDVPEAATLWLQQYYLEPNPLIHATTPAKDRLFIGGFSRDGRLVAVQGRALTNGVVKYLTYKQGPAVDYVWPSPKRFFRPAKKRDLFVCEDLTSAFRLDMLGYDAIALMGTKPPKHPIEGFDRAVLWLDNDRAGKSGAMQFCRDMSPLFKQGCISIYSELEPKEYSPEDLDLFIKEQYGH